MGYAGFRWLPTLQANIIAFLSNIMLFCTSDGHGEAPEGRRHDLNKSSGQWGAVMIWLSSGEGHVSLSHPRSKSFGRVAAARRLV